MAEFRLPANSRIRKGKHFAATGAAANTKVFAVYRYDPDSGENPRVDTYEVDLDRLMSRTRYRPFVTGRLDKNKNWLLIMATMLVVGVASACQGSVLNRVDTARRCSSASARPASSG